MKKLYLLIMTMMPMLALGQIPNLISWNVEAGVSVRRSSEGNMPRARTTSGLGYGCDRSWQDNYYYHYDSWLTDEDDFYGKQNCDHVGSLRIYHIGIKPEVSIGRLASVCCGLRLSGTHSTFEPDSYFFWLFQEKGVNTHYLRLTSIRQHSAWAGVPIECRFCPFGVSNRGLYFRAGLCLDWRLYTHNYADFWDGDLESEYASRVEEQISNPDDFNIPLCAAVGLQFGSFRQCCLELNTNFLRHAQMTSLMRMDKAAIGIQFTYRIPTAGSL